MTESKSKTRMTTGLVRLSYLTVFEPKAMEGSDKEKYSVSMIINKDDKYTLKKINAAIKAALIEGKERFKKDKVATFNLSECEIKLGSKSLKCPLRDGDVDRDEDEAYENAYFINANSAKQPQLVAKDFTRIDDEDDLKSGDYGRVIVSFYTFNSNGNMGVACSLHSIQKVKDGESLGVAVIDATEEFDDGYEFDDDEDFEDDDMV